LDKARYIPDKKSGLSGPMFSLDWHQSSEYAKIKSTSARSIITRQEMSKEPTIQGKLAHLLTTTISIVCLAPSVSAERPQLEQVTVTVQKRSQSANDIPMSISTYSGENMDQMGVLDATDIYCRTGTGYVF
jgi:hypothetical protein